MTLRFDDIHVHRHHRFSLGRDRWTGGHYLSTPISGHMLSVEYEAHYRISLEEFTRFQFDPDSADEFLEICRNHGHADRLIG